MELRQLRYFLAVAKHLHFTIAAEELGIAQPPLSQQIIKLEKEIGIKLFERYPRRVELTEAGQILQERAQHILDEIEHTLEHLKKVARGTRGHLSIGFAGSTVFHPLVAKTLRSFRAKYPDIQLRTEESNSTTLLRRVANNEIDCAIVRKPLDCQGLTSVMLTEESMIAVLPDGHRLSQANSLSLTDLAKDSFILFPRQIGPDLYDAIISACRNAGFSPQIAMESPQLSSAVNMVAAGFGVALIPDSLRHIHATGVHYIALKEAPLRTNISLIFRVREKSLAVQNFTRHLKIFSEQAM